MNKLYAAGGAFLIASLWFGISWHAKANHKAGYDAAMVEYESQLSKLREQARINEIRLQNEADEWSKKHDDLVQATVNAYSALSTERDGLLYDIEAATGAAEYEAAYAERTVAENARLTRKLRDVSAMCAKEYSDLAAVADGLRVRLVGLQGWAEIVLGK